MCNSMYIKASLFLDHVLILTDLEIDYFSADYIRFAKGWMEYLEAANNKGAHEKRINL